MKPRIRVFFFCCVQEPKLLETLARNVSAFVILRFLKPVLLLMRSEIFDWRSIFRYLGNMFDVSNLVLLTSQRSGGPEEFHIGAGHKKLKRAVLQRNLKRLPTVRCRSFGAMAFTSYPTERKGEQRLCLPPQSTSPQASRTWRHTRLRRKCFLHRKRSDHIFFMDFDFNRFNCE